VVCVCVSQWGLEVHVVHGRDPRQIEVNALLYAVFHGSLKLVALMLQLGCPPHDPKVRTQRSRLCGVHSNPHMSLCEPSQDLEASALTKATDRGFDEAVELLLQHGADVNHQARTHGARPASLCVGSPGFCCTLRSATHQWM